MDIMDIVTKYLEDNKYDGLVGEECGCDGSFPCLGDGIPSDCRPAYKHTVTQKDIDNEDSIIHTFPDTLKIGDTYYSTEKE